MDKGQIYGVKVTSLCKGRTARSLVNAAAGPVSGIQGYVITRSRRWKSESAFKIRYDNDSALELDHGQDFSILYRAYITIKKIYSTGVTYFPHGHR